MTSEADLQLLKQSVEGALKRQDTIAERQDTMIREHYKLEAELVELKNDMYHVRKSLDNLNNNINKILFIIGGGFIMAFVTWIVGGGLGNGNP